VPVIQIDEDPGSVSGLTLTILGKSGDRFRLNNEISALETCDTRWPRGSHL